jgi:hypothetical protein
VSERARAAESLFATQNEDEDAPPTVMYANSSNFVARGRNNVVAEETPSMGIFELMAHSGLWAELRRAATQPYCSLSASADQSGNGLSRVHTVNPLHFTYGTLPRNVQRPFRDLLLHSLGDKCLNGDQVVSAVLSPGKCEEPEGWSTARSYCSINVVVTALYELVKEGAVECI